MDDTPKRGKPAKPLDERRTQHRFTLDPKILQGYLDYCDATGTDANHLCDELLESIVNGGDPCKAIEYRINKIRQDLEIIQDRLVQQENLLAEMRPLYESTEKRHENPEYEAWLDTQEQRFIKDHGARKYIRDLANAGNKRFGFRKEAILKDLKGLA
jgi:hypothetical protein